MPSVCIRTKSDRSFVSFTTPAFIQLEQELDSPVKPNQFSLLSLLLFASERGRTRQGEDESESERDDRRERARFGPENRRPLSSSLGGPRDFRAQPRRPQNAPVSH